jgi:hypothetical protein
MLEIHKRDGDRPWKIIDMVTGAVVGSSETREKAERSMAHRVVAFNAKEAENRDVDTD